MTIAVHMDEEADQELKGHCDNLDEHERGLLRYILKDLKHKPAMGLSIFKRQGEYTVFIPIGARFEVRGPHLLCSSLVVTDTIFCCTEVLQKVVQEACLEAGVKLVKDVALKKHDTKRLKMYAFTVAY